MTIEKKRMLGHNDPRSLRIFEPSGLLNVAQEINEGTHLVNSPASELATLHSNMSHSLRTDQLEPRDNLAITTYYFHFKL